MEEKKEEEQTNESIDFVKWFSELNKDSGNIAGGKGANLSEIFNLKIPVPPGFVITAQAYDYFIKKNNLDKKIKSLLETIKYEDTKQLDETTKKIRKLILNAEIPKEMQEEILESYEALDTRELDKAQGSALDILKTSTEPVFVAVRSSATTEDLAEASFAGQQDSFVNIKGNKQLLEHIKKCFASLFTSRATYYRNKQGFKHEQASLAVVVQKMVDSDKSGVIFSKDPSYKKEEILIEAVWGLGEGIVSGQITPDNYIVSQDLKILSKKIANKKLAIKRSSSGEKTEIKLSPEKSEAQVLTEYEIKKLSEIALKLEEHYQKPQDIEFAIEGEDIQIVQTRPITTIAKRLDSNEIRGEIKGEVILQGQPASPGIAVGKIKIVHSLEDLQKVQQGDILVTKMTNPDMVVTMQKSAGIVTDQGGTTAHAAIVSREMGIPCFSGDANILTNKGFIKMNKLHKKILAGKKLSALSLNTKKLKIEWKKITNSSKRKAKTIAISISKNGKVEHDTLRTTPEHNFFTLNKRTPDYKQIQEIIKKNKIVYIGLRIPKPDLKNKFNVKKAYLCGAIFSDGYLRIKKDGSASTVFIQKDIFQKQEFIETVKNYFKKVYDYELKNVNKDYFYCYKKSITEDLIKIKENITQILLNCDDECLKNYLAGIIDGDGNFIKRGKTIKISLDKKHPQILLSLIITCLRLGIVYRIKTENNQYRFYLCSQIDSLKKYLKRLKIENTKKLTGDIYLSSKELFNDMPVPGRKGIKTFVKNNCLLSKEKIQQKIIPYIKDKKRLNELKKILNSDLRVLRIKNLNKTKKEDVFNIEVEKNHNYIVFSGHYSPIIVKNCIVGTQTATTKLKEGEIITIDGSSGKIYKGKVAESQKKAILPVTAQTKTKIKVIVDLPNFAERAAKTKLNKVGLTRIEGIIAESGKHPNYFLEQKKEKDYEEIIFKGVSEIAKYFDELWVRTSDIRSDEFQNLEGAPKQKEANPMLGMHGIRYSLKNPKIFLAELNALKRVSEQNKKIGLLFPQIISVEEVKEIKKYLQQIKFDRAKIGVMVETPAAVQIIKDLCEEKIDFISFGTNDLTQYLLAVDRGNSAVQHLYNELNPAILYQLSYVIRVCQRYKVETSICGQAGSKKEMVKYLVENGIDSITTNADMAKEISDYIEEIETNMVKGTDKEPRQYQPEKKEIPKENNIESVNNNLQETQQTPEQVEPSDSETESLINTNQPSSQGEANVATEEQISKDIKEIEKEKKEYLESEEKEVSKEPQENENIEENLKETLDELEEITENKKSQENSEVPENEFLAPQNIEKGIEAIEKEKQEYLESTENSENKKEEKLDIF